MIGTRMIDVNVRGVLQGIAAALPVMTKQGPAHFVNLSSTAGHTAHATAGVHSCYEIRSDRNLGGFASRE